MTPSLLKTPQTKCLVSQKSQGTNKAKQPGFIRQPNLAARAGDTFAVSSLSNSISFILKQTNSNNNWTLKNTKDSFVTRF